MQNIRIQIQFTKEEDGYPPFTSALYFPLEDWPVNQETIDGLKDQAFEAFKDVIDNPPETQEKISEGETE